MRRAIAHSSGDYDDTGDKDQRRSVCMGNLINFILDLLENSSMVYGLVGKVHTSFPYVRHALNGLRLTDVDAIVIVYFPTLYN